jgi:1,4-dihydroxy-2-naphthoyl-CoA hydrolase
MSTSIWKRPVELDAINALSQQTVLAQLGIEFTAIGDDWVQARMPVDARTHQPFGLLHGGCSVVLAETLGSMAAVLTLPPEWIAVGIEVNANHLRSMRSGWVIGTARALHIGRSTQVWEIRIDNEADERVCVSRLTLAVVPVQRV